MRSSDAIEALRTAGPLNVVWGAGCSYAGPNAATWLLFDLRVNCKLQIAGAESLHSALLTLDPKTRREKTTTYGINWAHICLAELLRTGRVARILTGNFDDGLTKAITALHLLPDLHQANFPELAECAVPSIYSIAEADPADVRGLIERGAQTGPWLVIGCSGDHFGLRDALLSVPRFEHGLYWVGYFNQRLAPPFGRELFAPARNTHFVGGFDSDSFMAYLLRGLGEFPPAFVTEGDPEPQGAPPVRQKPLDQLRTWCDRLTERIYAIRDGLPAAARELLQKAETARGDAYQDLVNQAILKYELHFRWSPANGYAAALFLGLLAEKRCPREAVWLRRKGLDWIARFPAGSPMEAMEARQVAETYAHLARFRTGAEADALFAQAEAAMPSTPSVRLGSFLIDQYADLLCQWVDQERNSRADAIFERACRKFAEAQRLHPDQPERLFRYAQALRQRAGAVSGNHALELLAAARAVGDQLLAIKPNEPAIWQFLGLLAILEAQNREGNQPEALAEAERCFRKAVSLRAEKAGDLLQNWASALCAYAATRSGPDAIELYSRAHQIFSESEQNRPHSRALRKNWSSALVREARERGGDTDFLQLAREQAEKAEEIDPGSGAYNLACISAELGRDEDVAQFLRRSAEHGQIMPLSHILRDVNFELVRHRKWFVDVLNEIFGAD